MTDQTPAEPQALSAERALRSAQRHMVHAHTFCLQCVEHAANLDDIQNNFIAKAQADAEEALIADAALRAATRESAGAGLAELRALSDAASSGPWTVGRAQDGETYDGDWWPQVWPRSGGPVADLNRRIGAKHKDNADAAFIVAAVNYVRARLAAAHPQDQPEPENSIEARIALAETHD